MKKHCDYHVYYHGGWRIYPVEKFFAHQFAHHLTMLTIDKYPPKHIGCKGTFLWDVSTIRSDGCSYGAAAPSISNQDLI